MFKQRSGTAGCVKKIGTAMDPVSAAGPLQCTIGFPNKNRVAILAELDKEKRKLLLQNQTSTNNPGASIALTRPNMNKDFRDHAEQQHIAAQQKAALQYRHRNNSISYCSYRLEFRQWTRSTHICGTV
uniref:SOSS complex subunit C n=1 Tax=Xenopus tropicalis TaxID=8364 RepID=A0A6I8RWB2_XENTR|eukprot:XP_017953033.1 PREDICTED: SOSS complex subunit C isoform X2 [Xenopus tropicalis]